jgi:protein TonB
MLTTHSAKSASPVLKAASSAVASTLKALACLSLASVVTVLLFRLDSLLVSQPSRYDTQLVGAKVVDFVRVQTEDYTQVKERRLPKKPPPPDRPPPPPKMRVNSPTDVPASAINMDLPDIEMNFGAGGGPYLGQWYGRNAPGQPDSDVVPIVRITPQYPRQALINGIEGWVRIEFTITPDGRVKDPVVIDSAPRSVFDRAAMQAILRWKFKPRFIDGQAIERRASQIITFELEA